MVFALFLILSSSFIYAELDIRINAALNDTYTTLYLETDSGSSSSFDGNDAEVPQNPETLPSALYSVVGSKNLIIDSWNSATTTRTINAVFTSSQTGDITLTWNSQSYYSLSITECTDSGRVTCISVSSSGAITDLNTDSSTKYFLITVIYTPPACDNDGSCESGETCTNCANDCGVCSLDSTSGGGGGGGGSTTKTASMSIELPHPISLEEIGPVEFNITLNNNGGVELKNVEITGKMIFNSQDQDIPVNFDRTSIDVFPINKKETINVRTRIDSEEIGIYEIILNANAESPSYETQSKVYLTFIGKNGTGIVKIVAFTEGIIDQNAECIELKGMIEEAKIQFDKGNVREALEKAQLALEACNNILSGPKKPVFSIFKQENILLYLSIAIILAILFGIAFNIYKWWRFGKLRKPRFFKTKNHD